MHIRGAWLFLRASLQYFRRCKVGVTWEDINECLNPCFVVRQSDMVLSLPSIISSLSTESMSHHLTILRRDLTVHFIDHILKQPTSILISSGIIEHKLSHIPSPPNEEIYTTRLENLSAVLTFLSAHFFSSLPHPQQAQFTRSLCKPIVTSLLNNLLVPLLPSSFDLLPPFLELVERAVAFEERFVVGMLGNDVNDRPVKAWSDGLCGHYERQRRTQILDSSRTIMTAPENSTDKFLVEVEVPSATDPIAVPIQIDEDAREANKDDIKDDAWGFDDDVNSGTGSSFEVDTDGWGFDDEIAPDLVQEHKIEKPSPSPEIVNVEHEDEPDPSGAWGWNDNEDVEVPDGAEETAWDDPWGEEPDPVTDPRPLPAPSITSPRIATRLEKAANKGKKRTSDASSTVSPGASVPLSSDHPTSLPDAPVPVPTNPASGHAPSLGTQSSRSTTQVPKESYLVSGRMKRIISVLGDALNEGKQFSSAEIFPLSESDSVPGSVILQSASSILDLHMALYPVKFGKDLAHPECGMQFSNDCLYLSGEVERVRDAAARDVPALVQERLSECTKRYKLLADSWYHDVIVRRFPVMFLCASLTEQHRNNSVSPWMTS
jgi:centromere/kinetochore protein ZW10